MLYKYKSVYQKVIPLQNDLKALENRVSFPGVPLLQASILTGKQILTVFIRIPCDSRTTKSSRRE